MIYPFVKFVHVIAAMVFFGLPFAFGRWWHAATLANTAASLSYTLARMRFFLRLHMNACALLLLATGVWLARSFSPWPLWLWVGVCILAASLVNIHLNLGSALRHFDAIVEPDDSAFRKLRVRIALFTAVHHSLVTAATAVMIFRQPL